MEQDPKGKAGPLDLDRRELRRNNFNIRRLMINTFGFALVVALLLCSYYKFVGGALREELLSWTDDGHKNNGQMQDGSSKGSQYLLGVGKADITGYSYIASTILLPY